VRKLTDSDKQEILKLYRETAETTSTLAERYDVSNSTISRLLKSTLPEDEYEYLVSLKRAARTPEGRAQVNYDKLPLLSQPEPEPEPVVPVVATPTVVPVKAAPVKAAPVKATPVKAAPVKAAPVKLRKEVQPPQEPEEEQPSPLEVSDSGSAIRRVRRRSSAEVSSPTPVPRRLLVAEQLELLEQKPQPQAQPEEITSISSPLLEDVRPEVTAIAHMLGEDLLDESEDDDLDDDDFDDDEDFDDDDELEDPTPLVRRPRTGEGLVRVLPLSAAHLPKTCYLVIDRASELITRPLKDFGDLGQIPTIETQQRTLPIFDNHRVAKRFSTKRDRVIKVPDSKMLHKARTHLQAKGITRLLIDGQVYSLSTMM
jgi:hypothetical protein